MKIMRRYIALCKKQTPVIPAGLSDFIVGAYCQMRQEARYNITQIKRKNSFSFFILHFQITKKYLFLLRCSVLIFIRVPLKLIGWNLCLFVIVLLFRQDKAENNSRNSTFTSARTLLAILRLATALARLRIVNTVEKDDVKEAMRLMEMCKDSLKDKGTGRTVTKMVDQVYNTIRNMRDGQTTLKVQDVRDRYVIGNCSLLFLKLKIYFNTNDALISRSKSEIPLQCIKISVLNYIKLASRYLFSLVEPCLHPWIP